MTKESNQALLAIILRSETKAAALLQRFKFSDLANASRIELCLTEAAFNRLRVGIELGRRVQELATEYSVKRIKSSSDAIKFCQREFSRLATDSKQEEFHIVTLDTKNKPIDCHQITVGTLGRLISSPSRGIPCRYS